MRLRLPASRDVRHALDALLFWSMLIIFATAPWWVLHSGLAEAFHELAMSLFPPEFRP